MQFKNILLIAFKFVFPVGTYRISDPGKIFEVVDIALDVGYRHFDSAVCYRNESHIGDALKVLLPKYNLKREDIFITSKISKCVFRFAPIDLNSNFEFCQ